MILEKDDYKENLIKYINEINIIFSRYYNWIYKISLEEGVIILYKKLKYETKKYNSEYYNLWIIDNKIKYFVDFLLLTDNRKKVLKNLKLNIKSEEVSTKILENSIKKWLTK